jgi:predicted SnoaL-like aldol condensation-catalyzing enzyme
MKSATIASIVVAGLFAGSALAADPPGAANVELVKTYVRAVRVATFGDNPERDLRPVADQYISDDYVEHAYPVDKPGREGYILVMAKRAAARRAPPASSNGAAPASGVRSLDRVLALKERYMSDGDYVIWVTELPGADPKGPPTMSFNMVHVVNGKVTEHWASS